MQREIKFRALKDDMSNHSFVSGMLVYNTDGVTPRIQAKNPHGALLFYTCLKGTEGQYTGFKDKNGKEIYEGDIVREKLIDRMQEEGWSWNYSIVEFEKGCWVLKEVGFDYSKYDSLDDFDHLYDACQDVEICGNIYENPELIN